MIREPFRTRLIFSLAIVASAALAAGTAWARLQTARTPYLVASDVWAAFWLAWFIWFAFFIGRASARPRRQWGFELAPDGFDAPFSLALARLGVPQIFLCGFLASRALDGWFAPDETDPFDTAFTVLMTGMVALTIVAIAVQVAMWWRGGLLRLTTEGVVHRGPFFRQFIPWEALAPGGPPAPEPRAWQPRTIQLELTRPEIVQRRGLHRARRDPRRPQIAAETIVDPRLLAWAIRWYTEHPEHRADIGTQAEHDRLVSILAPPQ